MHKQDLSTLSQDNSNIHLHNNDTYIYRYTILIYQLCHYFLTYLTCPTNSAGVGRTGVFITLSIVLERMRYEGVVDIFQTVKMLRTQRPATVQTEVSLPTATLLLIL